MLGKMMQYFLPQAPRATSAATRSSMRGNTSAMTKPEVILQSELCRLGILNYRINSKDLSGSPDLAFHHARLAVFVHGCFWHRCPYCLPHFPKTNQEYWAAKFARNRARDVRVRRQLRDIGWRSMTIWECRLKKAPHKAAKRVLKALRGCSE